MKTKETVMGIFLAAVMILSGCQIGLHDGENPEAEDGTVLLRISAEGSEDVKVSRSVLPQLVLSDISSYELWGDSGTGMRNLATFDPVTITDATVALIPGTWDFSLRAYKLEDLILQGDLEDRDISASSNSLAFILSPLTSGTGNIRITVNFPMAAGIAAAEAVSGEDEPEALTISGTGVTYTKTGVAAGNHFVSIRLLDSAGTLIGIVSELVVVRNNLLSEADVTLEPEDLRFTVLVPQGISAAALQSNGTVLINWASVAGGVSYRVYRAAAAETEYAYIGETAAAPYADTTATAGVSYTYKVRGGKQQRRGNPVF
jgi:hypothetical protein